MNGKSLDGAELSNDMTQLLFSQAWSGLCVDNGLWGVWTELEAAFQGYSNNGGEK